MDVCIYVQDDIVRSFRSDVSQVVCLCVCARGSAVTLSTVSFVSNTVSKERDRRDAVC